MSLDAKTLTATWEQMLNVGRLMHAGNLNSSLDGNISARLGEDLFLLTRSGVNKGLLEPDDLVVVDGRGGLVHGKGAPSTEFRLHLAVYGSRPDVNAVIHAHSPWASLCGVLGLRMDRLVFPESAFFLGAVPTVPYQVPGSTLLAEQVATRIQNHQALLLQRHGGVVVGKDLMEAFNRLEALEHLAFIYCHSKNAAHAELSAQERKALRNEVLRRGIPWNFD